MDENRILFVDLDGTLIKEDLSNLAFINLLKQNPLKLTFYLFVFLIKGKPFLLSSTLFQLLQMLFECWYNRATSTTANMILVTASILNIVCVACVCVCVCVCVCGSGSSKETLTSPYATRQQEASQLPSSKKP